MIQYYYLIDPYSDFTNDHSNVFYGISSNPGFNQGLPFSFVVMYLWSSLIWNSFFFPLTFVMGPGQLFYRLSFQLGFTDVLLGLKTGKSQSDAEFFSVHHIRRHMVLPFFNIGDIAFNRLVKVMSISFSTVKFSLCNE